MPARRFGAFALLIIASLLLPDGRTAGQGNPKAAPKPKPGAPLVADPNDLPKPGEPLSIRTLVQRPGPLKGVRSWTIETKRHRWYPTIIAVSPNGKHLATGGVDGGIPPVGGANRGVGRGPGGRGGDVPGPPPAA